MKEKPTLNNLKLVINKWGGKNIPTVYLEGESWYEVLQILANKVYESLEWIDGYFNTDLEGIVEKVLNEWQNDGTLQVVISEALQWELDEYKVLVNKQLAQNEIVVSKTEPSEAYIWYQDRGESGLEVSLGSGVSIANAIVSEDEIDDETKLWFDK